MDNQRVLEILLRLKSDVAGAQQIKTELKAVEAQAAQTAAALNQTATRTIRDTSGLAAGQDRGDSAAAVALRAQLDAQVAARNALRGIAGQTLVLDQKSVFLAELSAAAEAKKVVQMERQLIMEIQLEAAEARIAGNPAMAAKLEREAAIRLQALTIQRATNVSMELAIAQAERLVLAQEAGSVKQAATMTFTRGQATALAQQLATGNVSAQSISRSFSGFGSALSIAAIAGYALYQAVSSAADEAVRLAKEVEKETAALEKNVTQWFELAKAAGDFGDVIKIGEAIQPQLDALAAKLAEFRANEITGWQWFTDQLGKTLARASSGPGFNEGNRDTAISQIEQAKKNAFEAGNASQDAAQKAQAAWEAVNLLPLNDAVAEYTKKLDELKAKHAGIDRKAGIPEFNEWQKVGNEILLTTKRLDELINKQTKVATESERTADAIAKVDLGQLDKDGQVEQLETKILGIQDELLQLGVAAESPHEAFEKSKGLTAENEEAVLKLARAWATVLGEIAKVVAEQEEDREKARREAINASLREQQTLLQRIGQQQQLISENPFLSADQKQALTLASMTAQMAALGAAIARTKQDINNSVLDPELHARLQAQLQRDQFEFDSLKLKIDAIDQPFGTALVDWVNQMGTSAQQVAGLITNSLGTAISGISQSITGLIVGTKNWEQAWNQAVISILGGIVQMVVQWIAGQVAMFVIRQIFGKQEAATVSSMASASAAAWAPAATSASIASYGAAAGFGVAAYIAALAAGTAAASGAAAVGGVAGGFKRGGYTGDGGADEIAGPVHKREFVFDEDSTSRIGRERLERLRRSAPHFQHGGPVLPGDPGPPDPDIPPSGYIPHWWYNFQDTGQFFDHYHGGRYNPHGWPYNDSASGPPGSGGQYAGGGGGYSGGPGGAAGGLQGWYVNPDTGYWTRVDPAYGQPPASVNIVWVDPDTGIIVDPGSGNASPGAGGGYPAPGYTGPGTNPGGSGLVVIGRDTVTGAPIYRDSNGNLFTLPGTGTVITPGIAAAIRGGDYTNAYGQSPLSAASARTMMMASANPMMSPRMLGVGTGDLGRTSFNPYLGVPNITFDGGMIIRQPGGAYLPSGNHGYRGFGIGGAIPGPPSTTDSLFAMLATGEYVMQAAAVEKYGSPIMDAFNNLRVPIDTPRFATGGSVGGGSSSSSSGRGQPPIKLNIAVFDDRGKMRKWIETSEGQTAIIEAINGARHEIGLGAVNA